MGMPLQVTRSGGTAVGIEEFATEVLARAAINAMGLNGANTMASGGYLNQFKGTAVASAATTADIWAVTGDTIHITGTTGITAFPAAPQAGVWRYLMFDGACLLTHAASTFVLPGGVNYTTAAGDIVFVYADTTTKFYLSILRANGKAVVESVGLGANTFTAAQIYSDQQASRAMFIDCGMTFLDKGNSGTSTQTLDYTAGSHQKITCTGAHTIATSNWPPTGNLGTILLQLANGAANAITWPTVNWIKSDGTTTTTFASNGVTLATSGTDWVLLWSSDGGTTIYGKIMR